MRSVTATEGRRLWEQLLMRVINLQDTNAQQFELPLSFVCHLCELHVHLSQRLRRFGPLGIYQRSS